MSLKKGLLVPIAQVKSQSNEAIGQVQRVAEQRGSPKTVLLISPRSPRPGGRAAGSGMDMKPEQFTGAH